MARRSKRIDKAPLPMPAMVQPFVPPPHPPVPPPTAAGPTIVDVYTRAIKSSLENVVYLSLSHGLPGPVVDETLQRVLVQLTLCTIMTNMTQAAGKTPTVTEALERVRQLFDIKEVP